MCNQVEGCENLFMEMDERVKKGVELDVLMSE